MVKYKDQFLEDFIYIMDDNQLMSVWNAYCECNGHQYKVHNNNDLEDLDDLFDGYSKQTIFQIGVNSSYNAYDSYIIFNKEEMEMESADNLSSLIDIYDEGFQEYVLNNINAMKLLDGFTDVYIEYSTLDDELVGKVDIETYLKELYNDIYKALREEDWEIIVNSIDHMVYGKGDEE